MSDPESPHPARPFGPQRRLIGGELVGCPVRVLRLRVVDPRAEIARCEVGEREAEVGQVALRVDGDHREAGLQRFLDDDHAESGLARAGHADDHPVGRELVGRHADVARRVVGRARMGGGVDRPAQEQVCHGDAQYRPGTSAVPSACDRRSRLRSSDMAFTGFPVEAIEFYEQLEADNTKTFWLENKQRFVEHVKTPMLELTEALDDFGPFHVFRPNNDLRFSKNKPPYKTQPGRVR